MACIRVIQPGLMSTVQDLGRFGHSALGVPESGAVDSLSLRAGNRMLGNPDSTAAIEMTLQGGEFEFDGDAEIVIVGAAMPARIKIANGSTRDIPPVTPTMIHAGELLSIGHATAGCRAYLCVRGGLDSPLLMGSRSACLPGGFGGHKGRALRAGDALSIEVTDEKEKQHTPSAESIAWLDGRIARRAIRVTRVDGSELPPEVFNRFIAFAFRVSPQSDRAGLRLAGSRVSVNHTGRMISEGTPLGAVQLPEGGEPIILLHDRPTTGGYPMVACVIGADIAAVGQARPGDELRFEEMSIEAARHVWRDQEAEFDRLFRPCAIFEVNR